MGENEEYNTKALDTCFEAIQEKLELIHKQVQKTNGRVSALENWKWFITGGLAVVTGLLIPIIAFIVRNWRF